MPEGISVEGSPTQTDSVSGYLAEETVPVTEAEEIGPGAYRISLTTSHAEGCEDPVVVVGVHDIESPGPNAAAGMQGVTHMARVDLTESVSVIAMIKSLMTELFSEMEELTRDSHQMMCDARDAYASAMDSKKSELTKKANRAMTWGIVSASVGFVFAAGSLGIGMRGGNPQVNAATAQSTNAMGSSAASAFNAVNTSVSVRIDRNITGHEKDAALRQSFQQEFQSLTDSSQKKMDSTTDSQSQAFREDASVYNTVIGNLR